MKVKYAVMFAFALLLTGGAAHGFNPEGGDPAKGKEAFTACRKCHDGSKAEKMSPSHKTKKQWERYFDEDFKKLKKKHPDWDSFGYDVTFLENVYRYLVDHALDSDKPQTCD